MSTTIYTGYRLPVGIAVPALCRQLEVRLRPVQRDLVVDAVALVASLLIDHTHLPADAQRDRVTEVWNALSAGQVEPTNYDGLGCVLSQAAEFVDRLNQRLYQRPARRVLPVVDVGAVITFASDPDDPDHTYAITDWEHNAYTAAWEAIDGVQPFAYWNNSDEPDDVAREQWEERSAIWHRVIRDSLSDCGVTWRLLPHGLALDAAMGTHGNTSAGPVWLTPRAAAERLAAWAADAKGRTVDVDDLAGRLAGPALGVGQAPVPTADPPPSTPEAGGTT